MGKAELISNIEVKSLGPLKGPCCVRPGAPIKGTFFLGGAGLNGTYISKIIKEFHKAGIKSAVYLDSKKWSSGQLIDASINILFSRNYDPHFPMLLRLHNNSYKQFNLIGYSYGSLIAAQLAIKYAVKGSKVDHLVLIASPISRELLTRLHNVANIQNIIIINLNHQGDPIYAGISKFELAANLLNLYDQMQDSIGHFYYAKKGTLGDKRRKLLADYLYQAGLK